MKFHYLYRILIWKHRIQENEKFKVILRKPGGYIA